MTVPGYDRYSKEKGKWTLKDKNVESKKKTKSVGTVSYTTPTTLEFDYQGKHYVLDNRGFMGWSPVGDEWDQSPFVYVESSKRVESHLLNDVSIAKKVVVELSKSSRSGDMFDCWEEGTGGGVWNKT